MTSTFEKQYSQVKNKTTTRSFCPLILYHDKPSKQLSINLNVNKHNNRTAIDRHREKTNEMLEHNAQYWTADKKFSCPLIVGLVAEDDMAAGDYVDKEIKVSPSTSTTSNISSSSSSSGESIATIDNILAHHHNIRSSPPPLITSTSSVSRRHVGFSSASYYEDEEKPSFYQQPLSNKPSPSKSSPAVVAAVDPTKKRRRGNLPKEVTEFLRKWLIQHKKHPYPAEKEKADLARHTGLTVNQISNWFINARRRILQPMLESESAAAASAAAAMAYHPDLLPPPGYEPARRRRHDFYTYQRDFALVDHHPSVSLPIHHHSQQQPSYPHQQQQHHYLHSPSSIEEEEDEEEEERFTTFHASSRMMDDSYNNNNSQIPMR